MHCSPGRQSHLRHRLKQHPFPKSIDRLSMALVLLVCARRSRFVYLCTIYASIRFSGQPRWPSSSSPPRASRKQAGRNEHGCLPFVAAEAERVSRQGERRTTGDSPSRGMTSSRAVYGIRPRAGSRRGHQSRLSGSVARRIAGELSVAREENRSQQAHLYQYCRLAHQIRHSLAKSLKASFL